MWSTDWFRKSLRDVKSALGKATIIASRAVLRWSQSQRIEWSLWDVLFGYGHQILCTQICSEGVVQFLVRRRGVVAGTGISNCGHGESRHGTLRGRHHRHARIGWWHHVKVVHWNTLLCRAAKCWHRQVCPSPVILRGRARTQRLATIISARCVLCKRIIVAWVRLFVLVNRAHLGGWPTGLWGR